MKLTGFCFFSFLILIAANSSAQTINPDSTSVALDHLKEFKLQLVRDLSEPRKDKILTIQRMLDTGLWDEASEAISENKNPSPGYILLKASYLILRNEFKQAELLVNKVLNEQTENETALVLKATLEIHAWRLARAAAICEKALQQNPSEKLQLLLGRARLLQKNYTEALEIAESVLKENSNSAGAYLLKADVYFWNQQPALAESPLKRSLEIDPFNADARFSYGYAIWRRVDATQLNAMAAQWEISLAVNPLHFQTNWHWGNGHTNLTYADYAERDDDRVRKALEKADDLVRQNQIQEAVEHTRLVEKNFPESLLPGMHRASIYYIAYDINQTARLDSAENLFRRILMKKAHYGPAHNGLSAVIKSKRFPYLATYDSITTSLKNTRIGDMENFQKVFPDVSYYPGETVKAMVWNQLYTSVVYFPFLSRQNNAFRIPPLHKDLAVTMNTPSFRYMTTFDNRQWMDIRGVGSGAAAIEYVDRGAFQERNVILHEYVHLFHHGVLTDTEIRQLRALYYKAMVEKRTLDYYSQNNESEYFAQTYPAYFEPVKVHPLDFKSMNTSSDLKSKDPQMYEFLDQLVKKERAYLSGNKKSMASNWSQIYLNLSDKVSRSDPRTALAYLDTALLYDQNYLPAYLAHSQLRIDKKDFKGAEDWLKRAEKVNAGYAPIYSGYAMLYGARLSAKEIDQKLAVQKQVEYLKKATKLETDYQELAGINAMLREMYKSNGMIAEAIETAEDYGKNGAAISTYLRDRRDDAIAYAALLKSGLGYTETVEILKNLVAQKPQNFEYRNMYADALNNNKQFREGIKTLQEAQRILAASGNARSDYSLRIAQFYTSLGEKDSAGQYIQPLLKGKMTLRADDKLRYVRLLATNGYPDQAAEFLKSLPENGNPYYKAEYYYTSGKLLATSKQAESIEQFKKAIEVNPYMFEAYNELIILYTASGKNSEAIELKTAIRNLLKNIS